MFPVASGADTRPSLFEIHPTFEGVFKWQNGKTGVAVDDRTRVAAVRKDEAAAAIEANQAAPEIAPPPLVAAAAAIVAAIAEKRLSFSASHITIVHP